MDAIFITGISGFLGHNLVFELAKRKDVLIHGLVLPNEEGLDFFSAFDNVDLICGDIRNREDVAAFLSQKRGDHNIIIHAAGRITTLKKNDPLTTQINVEGTKAVVEEALRLGGFDSLLYVSSVDALPRAESGTPITEPTSYNPSLVEGVYSQSKAEASRLVLSASDKLRTIVLLPSAIMGPNDPFVAPINGAIKKFLLGKMPAIVSGGYDIVDVRDVAKGIVSAIDHGQSGSSYLLTGTSTSVEDLLGLAAAISKKKKVRFKVPHFLIKMISPFIEASARAKHKTPLFTGFSMDCLKQNPCYVNEKAKAELGYKVRRLEETMADTIAWMQESSYLAR